MTLVFFALVFLLPPVAIGLGIYVIVSNGSRAASILGGLGIAVGAAIIIVFWVPMIREQGYAYLPEHTYSGERVMSLDVYRWSLRNKRFTNYSVVQTNADAWLCNVVDVSASPPPDPSRHQKVQQTARIVVTTDC